LFIATGQVQVSAFHLHGHRILISKFIQNIRNETKVFKGKSLHKMHSRISKRSANASTVPSLPPKDINNVNSQINAHEDVTEDLSDIYSKICIQIINWFSAQTDMQLREVKEHEGYKIHVKRHSNGVGSRAAILCMQCEKEKLISVKNGSVEISNWSKHIKGCVQNKKKSNKNQKKSKQF